MGGVRSVTIDDVARLAGVSPATVSRVMNGNQSVSPESVTRVRDAANRLRYVPSGSARSLSLGRTNTVAFLVPDLTSPTCQQMLRGANRAATAAGYRLMAVDSVENPKAEADLAVEARRRSDALILYSPRLSPRELQTVLDATEPVVLINRESDADGLAVLSIDYAEGARLAMLRLIKLGHRRLVYLAGPERSISNQVRLRALQGLVRDQDGVALSIVSGGGSIEDGYAAMNAVLQSGATAVLAYNDVVAIGLLGRLNEVGVAVPGDLSVVGFDDIAFARYSTPPLTTVAVPKEELGRLAWSEVERLLAGDTATSVLRFPPRLVERGSTGPVPREAFPAAPREVINTDLGWQRDDDDVAAVLRVDGIRLAHYQRHPMMPDVYSPRPYLHPIYTLAGTPLTAANESLLRHQHGISLTFPWIDGISYWGGRTYVESGGPTLMANHGTQSSTDLVVTGPALRESVTWRRPDGSAHLTESRQIGAALRRSGNGWQLRWDSVLSPAGSAVEIRSPSETGKSDARYGGIFWRFPSADDVEIHSAEGAGGEAAHGSRSSWVALIHNDSSGGGWTVVLHQPGDPSPWHVRYTTYLAVCPAPTWDGPVTLNPGDALRLALDALILDDAISVDELPGLVEELRSGQVRADR